MRYLWASIAASLWMTAAWAVDVTPESFEKKLREGPYALVAPRAVKAPVIDGSLADECWSKAAVVKSFWKAGTTQVAEDQTIAWVCFDAQNLYVAFACVDHKVTGGDYERDSADIWKNDCVEVFLGPERAPDRDRQLILGAGGGRWDCWHGSRMGRFGEGWNPTPDWEGATRPQPWGYTAELRIPLGGIVDTTKYAVDRGTVWNLKLTREDFGGHTGCRTSSWTQIGSRTDDPLAIGRLVFEDRNLYTNGGAELADPKGGVADWRVVSAEGAQATLARTREPRTEGEFAARIDIKGNKAGGHYTAWMGRFVATRQPVETTFFFTADIRIDQAPESNLYGVFRLKYDGVNFKLEPLFYPKVNAGWQKVRMAQTVKAGEFPQAPDLHGAAGGDGVIYVDNVRFEIGEADMLGDDADAWCLTGNAQGPQRTRNRVAAGAYTYTDAMTTAAMFPRHSMHAACDEPGRYAGWIPFSKGKLTDGATATGVGWPLLWAGHQGQDITFDLGADYEITRVELLSGGKDLYEPALWLKSPGEVRYTLVAARRDLIAFDAGGWGARIGAARFDKVGQPARWVRVQAPNYGYNTLSELQIWGKDLAAGKRPQRKALLQGGGEERVKDPKEAPVDYRDMPPVWPVPREMKLTGVTLPLKDGLVIGFEPAGSARARATAEVLAEEMALCYGIKAVVRPAAQGETVLIGEAVDSPATAKSLAGIAPALTPGAPGPEGYVLLTDGGRAVIGGSDAAGAFYGCQALLAMVRRAPKGGWEVPGAFLRDWPATHYRSLMGRPVPTRNLIRTLARFRINYYEFGVNYLAAAAAVDPIAERYFVNLVPPMDPEMIVQPQAPDLVERAANEKLEELGVGRRNVCPSNPKTWEIYFKHLDEWLPKFHGDRVQIGFDEKYQSPNGSRWNVCALCRERNLTAPQLMADMINRIDRKVKQYGKKITMLDTSFMPAHRLSYPGDPDPQWSKAADLIPKDIVFCIWHPNEVNELLKGKGFSLVYMPLDDRDWCGFDFPGKYYSGMNYYMLDGVFKVGSALAEAGIAWNPGAPRPHDARADEIITAYAAVWDKLHEGVDLPSLAAGADDFAPLDLRRAANRSRTDAKAFDGEGWVDLGPNVDLRALKAGRRVFAGVPFDVIDEARNGGKGFVMLHNRSFVDRTLPDAADIDTGDLKAASLIFLTCLENRPGQYYLRRNELAGYLFMIYENGRYAAHELKYAVNTANWDGLPTQWGYSAKGHTMKRGRLVWRGQTTSGLEAFLYSSEWVNPRPDLAIKRILFRAACSPSAMNPMLFAVTAVKPDPAFTKVDAKVVLPDAARLVPAKPAGRLVELRGGRDESELKYIAPDGTIIEGDSIDNQRSDKAIIGGDDFRSWVGIVNHEGNEYFRPGAWNTGRLTYTFPQLRFLTGVLVTGAYRTERKSEDFPPTKCEYTVEADFGAGWTPAGKAGPSSPEETGAEWMALPQRPIKALRVSFKCLEMVNRGGLTTVKLFEPAEAPSTVAPAVP